MGKRTDIRKILIIGSGPIVISQACEFDYSGSQACKALKEEGYQVVLVNSNPATIMTDPQMADATYVEPLTPEILARVIEKERPDALLPTLGGQTGLNLTMQLAENKVLDKFHVECIGATVEAINRGEDRKLFKETMRKAGIDLPESGWAHTLKETRQIADRIGFPLIIRPSFTLGGTGGGIAYNKVEFETIVERGLTLSPVSEVLIEESVIGWKEFELEVMRDRKDNVVIICSIENLDPMGIHTGDSITVAPIQTLTDREYQKMRDAAITCIRAIGVDTGGSNIQFAVNPRDGQMVIIEMNPRVSRSSALASKATGFPIARIAAKLAVGYTLDEIPNDITQKTPASFEPTIDYCVVKIPRFTFEKFPFADSILTTSMKSVGEIMAIGRTFKEALGKGLRSLEINRFGPGADNKEPAIRDKKELIEYIRRPTADRIFYLYTGLKTFLSIEEAYETTGIDPWFLSNLAEIVAEEKNLKERFVPEINKFFLPDGKKETETLKNILEKAKRLGFSDYQLACISGKREAEIRNLRHTLGLRPAYKLVDTCAAEFAAATPYFYSTYERENEVADRPKSNKEKVIILGAGPNRIGQGIEFDYACVHASLALREAGYESIMVNCNPETVSTDYDISDRLYFEPLTLEDILEIVATEKPKGVIVQLGGQTPLNLALDLEDNGVHILGTKPEKIDQAEDRKLFKILLDKLGLKQPPSDTASSFEEAAGIAKRIGYPILVRPSYVLGGRAMEIVYNEEHLSEYLKYAVAASSERPVLIDRFLEDATEVDVDAISDGKTTLLAGIMEHIEEAGIHSGDSAMVLPPHSLSYKTITQIREATYSLATELEVIGLMNIQFAVKDDELYILEVNPRASRTIPFVSKTIGIPLAKLATRIMLGEKLEKIGFAKEIWPPYTAVKESVFPFNRFLGVDAVLGPEMRSTGEVMGIDTEFGLAYAKSQLAAGTKLPLKGNVFISVKNKDKPAAAAIGRKLKNLGFDILATRGTASALIAAAGIPVKEVLKISEGRPNIMDYVKNGEVQLIINTPSGVKPRKDTVSIRAVAVARNIPLITTIPGAQAAVSAISKLKQGHFSVTSLQDYYHTLGVDTKI